MTAKLTLVSHKLCPYVQRAAIVLAEQGIAFDRVDIDLAHKPDWFLTVSPLGKTPVLLVNGRPIFESAVICEYLDETASRRLHPQDALERARHRGWIEFGSAVLNAIGGFYNARDKEALLAKVANIRSMFEQLEAELAQGPYFGGERFTMVDAAFGPVFRYFDVFEQFEDFGFFARTPRVRAWRAALAARASVQAAASPCYPTSLRTFLLARESALSTRIQASVAAGQM
ncbi:glutathione S-transferase family protein [Aquabacterium sp.]|uniref:glutathione S-transferase family protein n=1 Tax=Aquabacterium sp. TaxID=1872578 RepID=UPI002486E1E1|nr:glutathione S-transferase family protein [Aquabacterium sp.]MDI1260827.1 glutathione S-transferase family protein [Aquabacterium sp.]